MTAFVSTLRKLLEFDLFKIAGTPISVATVVAALLVAASALWLSRLAERGVIRFLQGRGVRDEGSLAATGRLVHWALLATGLAIAVHTLGVNLAALFTAGAVLAIAVGFAMQNIAQNFVSGLILLVERTIKPGDVIEVEGKMVRITRLGMRATVTRTWDAEDMIIPNSILVASTVKNFTLRDRLYRIRCLAGVSYDSDMRLVRRVLEQTARDVPWRDKAVEPVILMKQFGSSSVDFDVSVWVDDPFGKSVTTSNLNEAVWFALKDHGITIAYPQLDLHAKEPVLVQIHQAESA